MNLDSQAAADPVVVPDFTGCHPLQLLFCDETVMQLHGIPEFCYRQESDARAGLSELLTVVRRPYRQVIERAIASWTSGSMWSCRAQPLARVLFTPQTRRWPVLFSPRAGRWGILLRIVALLLLGFRASAAVAAPPEAAERILPGSVEFNPRPGGRPIRVAEVKVPFSPGPAADLPFKTDLSNSAVESRLRTIATFLAHDRLQGRGVSTHGLDLAADYIADQLKSCGVDTKHFHNSPFQTFRLRSLGGEGAVQQLAVHSGQGELEQLKLGQNYTSVTVARTGRFDLPVVFAGFGITAPEVSYDDYSGLDVQGAAVILLRHCPPAVAEGGENLASHSWIRTKIRNAVEHGAQAVLLCNDLAELERVRDELKLDPEKAEPLLRAELTPASPEDAIPAVHCRRSVLKSILTSAGLKLDQLETEILRKSQPASCRVPGARVSGLVSRTRTGRKLRNVLGLISGRCEVAAETIILGAHYDHLGRGGWGSLALGANQSIHNGADDNASGTAVMIEVARQLAARKEPLKRSVLFIAFSGEELGLLGSKQYVRDPLVPLRDTVAMLNLDMVGRLRNDQLTVYGTGTSTAWPDLIESRAKPLSLRISSRSGGYGPSDHASFYEKGIPVLHFFTGFHPQYHRPSDDVELLNITGMRKIASFVSELIVGIADSEARLVRSHMAHRLADLAPETLEGVLAGQGTRQRRVVLGVVPRKPADGKGLRVESTVPLSPAARYGLRVGDVILRVDNQPVACTRELTARVQAHAPGERVVLQVRRNGILLELNVKL